MGELCDLGQVTYPPRTWFPYLKSGSDSSCLRAVGRIEGDDVAWCLVWKSMNASH